MFSKFMPKVFWFFYGVAPFNNIYIMTMKQLSQLIFNRDNFVFLNKCDIVISYETLISKKHSDKLPKALAGC